MDAPSRGTLDISTAGTAAKGHNYFLGIGVDAYAHFPALANARKDVEDLRDLLVQHYYFDLSHTTLLCGAEASRKNILRQLNEYRKKATADDRLLVYYAGHGLFDGNLGFWIPAEAERDDISGYVSNADLREIMRSIPARHILLISDSCFSASLMVRDASRGAGGSVFEDFERNASRWVFISGKGVVSDGQPGYNSPFAGAILKHLRQNPTEALNIAQLADQVTKEVRFNYEQQAEASPLYQAGHAGGQFVFQKRLTERDDWQKAQQAGTEGAFLAFLGKYPDSVHTPEAENQLAELADEIAWRKALLKDSAYDYRQYLKKYAQGRHAAEAKEKLEGYEAEEQARQQEEATRLEQERLALLKKQETDQLAREKEAAERVRQQQETRRMEQEQQALLQKQAAERAVRERQAALQQRALEHQTMVRQAMETRQTDDHPAPISFLLFLAVLAALVIWRVVEEIERFREKKQPLLSENTHSVPANEKQGGMPFNPNKTDKSNTPDKGTANKTVAKVEPKDGNKSSKVAPITPVTTDANVASVKKATEEKKRQQQEEADQRVAAENERRRQEQEAADKKRQEQEARDKKKDQFGSTFGKPGTTSIRQGNTGKPGNQSIPDGTGTSNNPFGVSPSGGVSSSLGGGVGSRKIVSRVKPSYNNSYSQGTVRVSVCVDPNGNVTSAKSTLSGSSTSDGQLRDAAETAARSWKFGADPNAVGEQCGWIDFNFKLL